MEPLSQYYYSHRLKLHFWDWGNQGKPNLLLVHGGRDHARSWDRMAEALLEDFRVVAPDLRGHGDSSWTLGGMYSVPEYVLDISALVDIVGPPVYLVGHSLGGAIVLMYAAIYPDKVKKLVSIEGFGPPPENLAPRDPSERIRKWIESIRECEVRQSRRYPDLKSAVARMKEANAHLSNETARHLTLFGSNWNADGTLEWKFDNYFRAFSPFGFNQDHAEQIWGRIRCPTLLIRGEESWVPEPKDSPGVSAIQGYRSLSVPRAGHWVHHDQPEIVLGATHKFLTEG